MKLNSEHFFELATLEINSIEGKQYKLFLYKQHFHKQRQAEIGKKLSKS